MDVRSRDDADAFTTLDGSTIRVLLDDVVAGARNQSLAEAELQAEQATQRHYHAKTEEIYIVVEGRGMNFWTSASHDGSRPCASPYAMLDAT